MSEDDLPATTPRYRYEGTEQCVEIMDKELQRYGCEGDGNPYVVFFAVDERSFQQDFLNPPDPIAKYFSTYNFNSTTLLLKMPSRIHSSAQNTFADIFLVWRLKQTSYLESFAGYVRGSSQGKCADLAWRPFDMPSHRDTKWPTVVVEVKWTEGRGKLQRDMKFWLGDSRGDVKVALTVSVQNRGRITVERWDLSPGGDPFPYQTMEIRRGAEGPLINGEINVEFRDAFLRDKKPTESDFTLTQDDMKYMAREVWRRLDQEYS